MNELAIVSGYCIMTIFGYIVGVVATSLNLKKVPFARRSRQVTYKNEKQKVLIIRPSKFAKADEEKRLKDIKPDCNGIIHIPVWCDYEFGEIERIIVKGEE